jgi:TatD DNase family protein
MSDNLDYVDIHAHMNALLAYDADAINKLHHKVLFSAHNLNEIRHLVHCKQPNIFKGAAVHPQQPSFDKLEAIEQALLQGQLNVLGEMGFDYAIPYKNKANIQEQLFVAQLNLALHYNKAIVIHCRKAMHKIFEHSALLKKLPAVVFHNYSGTSIEAKSLLKRGINSYFSIGTPLIWGAKAPSKLLVDIELSHIIFETDAPYQPERGLTYTPRTSITTLYRLASHKLNCPLSHLKQDMLNNFTAIVQP